MRVGHELEAPSSESWEEGNWYVPGGLRDGGL